MLTRSALARARADRTFSFINIVCTSKLPHGWRDDAWSYDVDALGTGACEG